MALFFKNWVWIVWIEWMNKLGIELPEDVVQEFERGLDWVVSKFDWEREKKLNLLATDGVVFWVGIWISWIKWMNK